MPSDAAAQVEFDFGIKAGASMSDVTGASVSGGQAITTVIGGGLLEVRHVERPLSFQFETLYARKGVTSSYFSEPYTTTLDYIHTNLLARLRLHDGSVRPSIIGGQFASFRIGYDVSPEDVGNSTSPLANPDRMIRKFDYGLALGLDLRFPRQFGTLFIDGRFERSIETIGRSNSTRIHSVLFTRAINITLGYIFP